MSALNQAIEHELRDAISSRSDELVALASELVKRPSTLGEEESAQRIVEDRLRDSGFSIARVQPDTAAALSDPTAGYPPLSYDGRTSVVGVREGSGGGRSLHLSGHIDVVPVDRTEDWRFEPWAGAIADGRLWGRGAGDMKGGLAAYLVAVAAISDVCGDRLRGDLIFSSVIEEECGGNGMWSVLRAGYQAAATLIGESTGMRLGHAGVGVVWARLTARGEVGHAESSGRYGPFDALAEAIGALRALEAAINAKVDDRVFADAAAWPYAMTVGRVSGGVWASSAPGELVANVRFGFGREYLPADVQARIREAVAQAAPTVEVTFEGFRAAAYCHGTVGELSHALSVAHESVLGSEVRPVAFTATTDARFVLGPCYCYGPLAGNMHGVDEWVDISSLQETAAVIALVAADWAM
jgi:acetylornithine deacetylase